MLVVLKISIVYLCLVVWWAVRSEPRPEYGPDAGDALVPLVPCGWDEFRRRRARLSRRPLRPAPRPRPRVGVSAS
jgi:hypothetical protein